MDKLENVLILSFRGDYIVHAIQFLPFLIILGFLNLSILNSIFLGLLFAVFLESIQWFLPYRSFNVNDLIANSVGVLAGVLLLPFDDYFRRILNRIKINY